MLRVQANPLIGTARRVPQPPAGRSIAGSRGPPVSTRVLCALGLLGVLGVLTSVFLLTAAAGSSPAQWGPGGSGGWPGWLAGPFESLGVGRAPDRFQTLTLII